MPAKVKKQDEEEGATDTAEEAQESEETVTEETAEFKPKGEIDPSFNCVDCKGEGLLQNGNVCQNCHGTGKAEGSAAYKGQYKPGTQVIKQDGTYIVNDKGEEVKQE